MTNKNSKNETSRQNKISRVLSVAILLICALFFTKTVSAGMIAEENFNTYTDGQYLKNLPLWNDNLEYCNIRETEKRAFISNDILSSSPFSASFPNNNNGVYNNCENLDLTSLTGGNMPLKGRIEMKFYWTGLDQYSEFFAYNNSTRFEQFFMFKDWNPDNLSMIGVVNNETVSVAGYITANTWNTIQQSWNVSLNKLGFKVNNGEWVYINPLVAMEQPPNYLVIKNNPANTFDNLNMYVDDIKIFDDTDVQDNTPPIIIINTPKSDIDYFHSNKFKIDYHVNDDISGVASATIAIDGNILSTTTVDLFDYTLGLHVFSVKAEDRAGNESEKAINFKIAANIDSSIFDVNKTYDKNWLIKESNKNTLVSILETLKQDFNPLLTEKTEIEKLINEINNNQGLTATAKKRIIKTLERLLTANNKSRQATIKNSLNNFQKVLDKIKQKNEINQQGYDVLKADIDYLRNNL